MKKHTPGPWKVFEKELSGAYQIAPALDGSLRICTVTNAHNDKANARLIAAAPKLLSASKQLLAVKTEAQGERAMRCLEAVIFEAEGVN